MKAQYMEWYRRIALNIVYYRKLRGYTQEQLAEIVDIERTHMSKIENSTVGFSFDLFFALAEALEVSPKSLLDFRE